MKKMFNINDSNRCNLETGILWLGLKDLFSPILVNTRNQSPDFSPGCADVSNCNIYSRLCWPTKIIELDGVI